MRTQVTIIDYGAGNIQSLQYALERLDARVVVSADREEIATAERVIFPGVGAAGDAMEQLRKTGLDKLIPELQQPVLGICLGMQLMCRHSDEGDTDCLGIFSETTKRFVGDFKIPHMGWNTLLMPKGRLFEGCKEGDHVYFVHSYFIEENDKMIAGCAYGQPFCAAIQKENFYATQFHPEKSGEVGERILYNFLQL